MRVGVLVPEVPDVPWYRVWEYALAHQARFWGGSANVPFPLDETLIDEELFWALADRLDPDGWVVHTGKHADLAHLDPDRYAAERGALAEAFEEEMPPAIAAGPINIHLEETLVEEWPSDEWQELLRRRGASLDMHSLTPSTSGDQHDAPPYPFTDVLSFQDLPEHPVTFTTELGDLERLLLTTEVGRFTDRSRKVLEDRTQPRNRPVAAPAELAEILFTDLDPFVAAPWFLSEWHLAWYARSLRHDLIPLVVGGAPLDFTLFYALRRMRGLAYWLPADWLGNASFVRRLGRELERRAQRSGARIVIVSATAEYECKAAALETLRIRWPTLGDAHVGSWSEVLPESPNRLYERDKHARSQPLVVHGGRTPEVASPLPASSTTDIDRVHWISEVRVRDWQPVRNCAMGETLAPMWEGDPTVVRTSADGIAYRCPPSFAPPSRSLAGLVVNPELRPLDLLSQIQHILEVRGWRGEPSDKGTYARESAALFGGFEALCRTLRDPEVGAWLAGFVGDDPYGMFLQSARRYVVTYGTVEARFPMDPDRSLRHLEDAGALVRGLVLKCRRCRNTAFYEVDELGRVFRCGRCRLEQAITRDSWLAHSEPPWNYGLAEVLYQLLCHNGHLPLLAVYGALENSHRPLATAYELELHPPEALRVREDDEPDQREVDIVVSDGHRLWVGEATTSRSVGKGSAEMMRLRELAQFAETVDAYGVYIATSQPAFQATTSRRLRTALDELRVPPIVQELTGVSLWPDLH